MKNQVFDKKYRAIFFGTPEFAVPVLKSILTLPYLDLIAVVTQPDKPVGRRQALTPSPVKIVAQVNKVKILQPENIKNSQFEESLKELSPAVIILVAYGKIIPKNLLEISKFGWLNIHASLLPKFRGSSPIQTAILEGEKETGVTLMKIDSGLDTGSIISQKKLRIESDDNFQTLHDQLSQLGADLLKATLEDYLAEKLSPTPQDHTQATNTTLIKKEDGKIDWSKPALYIDRQIRALNPWPGTWIEWQGKRLKILEGDILNLDSPSGKAFLTSDKKLAIGCGKASLLISKLQLEGKKVLTASEFLRGYPEIINTVLK